MFQCIIYQLNDYFRLLQIPPVDIHRKSTGNDSGKRPESFKFWCLESEEEDVKDGREGRGWGKGVMEMEKSRGIC